MVLSIPFVLLVAGSIPSGGKTFTKNCVNYQPDNLLIKGVVGSTIKTRQPNNVGDDRQESSTIKCVTRGPLESYTGGQKLQIFFECFITKWWGFKPIAFFGGHEPLWHAISQEYVGPGAISLLGPPVSLSLPCNGV